MVCRNKNYDSKPVESATSIPPLKNKIQVGFTLAEVLITLGIIGVVAAMTIPNLIAKYQKEQTVVKLKKAISILNQAYKLSYDDVGEPSSNDYLKFTSKEYINTYLAPYIKISNLCVVYSDCGYTSVMPHKYANGKLASWWIAGDGSATKTRVGFMTHDGFMYMPMYFSPSNDGKTWYNMNQVILDINGAEGPNRYGRDVFWLTRVQKDGGGINLYGYDKTDAQINANCSKNSSGEYCAEKIRRAGWKIEKDYPW